MKYIKLTLTNKGGWLMKLDNNQIDLILKIQEIKILEEGIQDRLQVIEHLMDLNDIWLTALILKKEILRSA